MERPGPSKPSSRPHGSSIFTKSQNSEKYEKVRKSGPKSDPRGGTKIDFVTPFASELVVWRRQLAQIRALANPRCKKGAKHASRRPTNWSKTQKKTEKPPESAQKELNAEKKRASCTRGSKNTREHHSRAAGAPKTQNEPQKNHEWSN